MTARRKQPDADDESVFLDWVSVVGAAAVCALGLLLLWGVWWGSPTAADFSRVGGASRVGTALEAARFWLAPPRAVVETQTHSGNLMLRAAQCAVLHHAPLLFTSPNPKEQRQVDATINDWRKIETPDGVAPPEVITIKSQRDFVPAIDPLIPRLITNVTRCLPRGNLTHIPGLSRLWVPNPLIGLPGVPPQPKLAHVVVFAADIEPGHPPDVAVGLALAAHMARANQENVSLVVVPHYLESDQELVAELQGQHELVTGGIVLGQTPTVPEETRALLRQLITSRDGHGILAELQDNLGSAQSLIGALVALVGAVATTRAAAPIVNPLIEKIPELIKSSPAAVKDITESAEKIFIRKWREIVPEKKSDWLSGLSDKPKATIWLRSGRHVSGTIVAQIPTNSRDATVFRVEQVSSSSPPAEGEYVLVSVKEIERIDSNDSKPQAGNVASP